MYIPGFSVKGMAAIAYKRAVLRSMVVSANGPAEDRRGPSKTLNLRQGTINVQESRKSGFFSLIGANSALLTPMRICSPVKFVVLHL